MTIYRERSGIALLVATGVGAVLWGVALWQANRARVGDWLSDRMRTP